MTERRPRVPQGPAASFVASVWGLLAAPATLAVALLWLGGMAAIGLGGGEQHPAGQVLAQLPAAVVVFCVLVQALERRGWRRASRLMWVAGLSLALAGAAAAGGGAGRVHLGDAPTTETYTVARAGRPVTIHLGGQLSGEVVEGTLSLWLGVGNRTMATASVPLVGSEEISLGPWRVHILDVQPGDVPALARLRVRPRKGGATVEVKVRARSGVQLDDGTQLAVEALSADQQGALGAAAQIRVTPPRGQATSAWYYVDAPGLDERSGTGPYIVELMSVDPDPRVELGIRRAGDHRLALLGWGLMAAALLLGIGRPDRWSGVDQEAST